MSGYYLGVDVGGTKCHGLVADGTGQAVGFGSSGPGNPEVAGWEGLRAALYEVTHQALAEAGIEAPDVSGAGFGIAGYDWPCDLLPIQQAIAYLGLAAPIAVVNDAMLGLLAGAREGWGVVITAGTSNNCRGLNCRGDEGRITGNGPPFGEYGGAAELVARAIQQVSKAWSRRGPATELTERFVDIVGASDTADLLEGLARGRFRLSAADAALVFAAEANGDPVARDLVRWAGRELGSLATGVIRQLGLASEEFDAVMAGSLFDGGQRLVEALRQTIHEVAPRARLVRLAVSPVVGAVLLGMNAAHHPWSDSIRSDLIRSSLEISQPGQSRPTAAR